MEWETELENEIVGLLRQHRCILFLTPNGRSSERYANLIRGHFDKEEVKLKRNTYMELHNRGWVLFKSIHDISVKDNAGGPHIVYWPTKALDYQAVPYSVWKNRGADIWRVLEEEKKEEVPANPLTEWQHLLKDDDD